MADTFGLKKPSRDTEGGKFYAWPAVDVLPNTLYFPSLTSSLFGVSEIACKAYEKSAFSYWGTFDFTLPEGWTHVQGQPVYYKPATTTEGTFSTTATAGSTFVGWELATGVTYDVDGDPELTFGDFLRVDIQRVQGVPA